MVNFDLRAHVESLGHGVAGCVGVSVCPRRCEGFLTKRGGRVKTWRRRWFLFDLDHRRLAYYTGEKNKTHPFMTAGVSAPISTERCLLLLFTLKHSHINKSFFRLAFYKVTELIHIESS